jgi:hypothetical protein
MAICTVSSPVFIELRRDKFLLSFLFSSGVFLIVSLFIAACIFNISHKLIRPLRALNVRLKDITAEVEMNSLKQLQFTDETQSADIVELGLLFKDLIQDLQFSQNSFL